MRPNVVPVMFAVAAALTAGMPDSAHADCTCRALGADYALGQTACLRTPAGNRLARCEMALNNTSWTFTEAPCPTSRLLTDWAVRLAAADPHGDHGEATIRH